MRVVEPMGHHEKGWALRSVSELLGRSEKTPRQNSYGLVRMPCRFR